MNISLIQEINETRRKLYDLIYQNDNQIDTNEIIKVSQELDLLLVQYMKIILDAE